METPAKMDGNQTAPLRGWRLVWVIVLFLIPIPFSPWWLGIICFATFGVLMWLLVRKRDSK
jgi:hypothetical protein